MHEPNEYIGIAIRRIILLSTIVRVPIHIIMRVDRKTSYAYYWTCQSEGFLFQRFSTLKYNGNSFRL